MEAKDLMIGDWVKSRGKIEKVTSVYEGYICTDSFKDSHDYYFEPIPLTPEILEKNGFTWDGSGQRSMMFNTPIDDEGVRYFIYVGFKRGTIEIHAAHPILKCERWRKANKVYLEVCGLYVHELQHALRLCGIEKEIEL